MTSDDAVDLKEVVHLAQALKAYEAMPVDVQESFDKLMTGVQNGWLIRGEDKRALKGSLSGISELRLEHLRNAYRVYYVAEFDEVVFVLDAGSKKSHQGGEIPNEQVAALINKRKAAQQHYIENRAFYQQRFQRRQKNRQRLQGLFD